MRTTKYTREELEAMPARELDAVVAERVMGWREFVPHRYSTDWSAMGEVVERLHALGFGVGLALESRPTARWFAYVYCEERGDWEASHAFAPTAVAIAAVLAVQGGG